MLSNFYLLIWEKLHISKKIINSKNRKKTDYLFVNKCY